MAGEWVCCRATPVAVCVGSTQNRASQVALLKSPRVWEPLTTLGRKAMQKYLIKTLKPTLKTFKTTKKNTPTLTKTDFPLQVSQWSELGVYPVS